MTMIRMDKFGVMGLRLRLVLGLGLGLGLGLVLVLVTGKTRRNCDVIRSNKYGVGNVPR